MTSSNRKQDVYHRIETGRTTGRASFAMLIDPDKLPPDEIPQIAILASRAGVDYFFVGGSLMMTDRMDACLRGIKAVCDIPTVLFPGSPVQLSEEADALLFLSLISGRNPDLLIGQHVITAPALMRSSLEILPTGYLLVDGGKPTTVSYISNTQPIPADKPEITVATAMAGQLLGLQLIYLDAGSGARHPVPPEMIRRVRKAIDLPLIVGGGIRTPEEAEAVARAGADVIVVGNRLESDPELVLDLVRRVHTAQKT